MSDTMTEGVIDSWVKKVGDQVKPGDVLAEVETDKATMELESYSEGTLLYIGVKEGETVPVDAVIAVIGKQGEDYKSLLGQESGARSQESGGDKKQESGDRNQESGGQQKKAEAQPEKAPAENKPNGTAETKENKSAEAKPEPKQSEKQEKTEPKPEAKAQEPQRNEEQSSSAGNGRIMASPLAKKIAGEKGVPLQQVTGTGDAGRIVKRDVENYKQAPSQSKSSSQPQAVQGEESYQDVPVSQMRKAIARRLVESKFSSPHFYLTVDINMERAMQARKQINDFLGEKVSFNDIIIRAAAAALRLHPKVNASWLGDKIRYYGHIHIGVAIAVEEGLVVPVVKFADTKSISAISGEVKDFAEKAKNKKLQQPDFEGNTFTISNLGMFGIEDFTAIINPPDACILAVGAIREAVVVSEGQMSAGHMMKVTLSCDHRVVDGAKGAQFLQTFKQILEEPVIILA